MLYVVRSVRHFRERYGNADTGYYSLQPEVAVLQKLIAFARKHIILFGIFVFIDGVVIGVGLGVYYLPIITAEKGLDQNAVAALESSAERSGVFHRDLADSDGFHWGEGKIMASATKIWLDGEVAPGPDYRLYLTPEFVETEAAFLKIKSESAMVGSVKAFKNFSLTVPEGISVADYPALIIWCEAFGQFITAAELK